MTVNQGIDEAIRRVDVIETQPVHQQMAMSGPAPVYIFWDNSNLFIPMQQVATERDGVLAAGGVRLHFDNLFKLARAGRSVGRAICVGSVPPGLRTVWQRIESLGVEVELYERGADSSREQAVDQALQVHMLRTGYVRPAGVAVLMTGDGAGYDKGVGFHADLERLADAGWGIEVLSWDMACNRRLREFAQRCGVYVPLEKFYESITFIEGGRKTIPVSLVHRKLANPSIPLLT
jgi:hypothetical protein